LNTIKTHWLVRFLASQNLTKHDILERIQRDGLALEKLTKVNILEEFLEPVVASENLRKLEIFGENFGVNHLINRGKTETIVK